MPFYQQLTQQRYEGKMSHVQALENQTYILYEFLLWFFWNTCSTCYSGAVGTLLPYHVELVTNFYLEFDNLCTVDWEYFDVTKVTWVKCSMSFNFVNLAGIRNLFNSGYFITQFFRVTCTCIVIEMAACEMESCVRGYHVYKDLWDASIGEDILCEREPFNNAD